MRRILGLAKDWARIASGSAQNLIDPPVVVLLYHRVALLERDPQQLAVTPENFRAHLAWLRAHYPVLRFEEDMTQSEIAARIGISQMHVSRLIRRALDRLRTVADGQPG